MDIIIHSTFLPHSDSEASLAFYRDVLGFEVRNQVEYGGMHWNTVGPPQQPEVNVVLYPPGAEPGVTEDERRTINEMMAKAPTPASCWPARTSTASSSGSRPPGRRSCRSRPTSRGAPATAPSATPRAT